jgi:hypothetical protein
VESRVQIDLEGFSRKGARLLKNRVVLTMNRSSLSPSTPPYIGGGAEDFVMYKLQTAGDTLSSSRIITSLIPNISLTSISTLYWASKLRNLRVVGLQRTPGTFFGRPIWDAYVNRRPCQ